MGTRRGRGTGVTRIREGAKGVPGTDAWVHEIVLVMELIREHKGCAMPPPAWLTDGEVAAQNFVGSVTVVGPCP